MYPSTSTHTRMSVMLLCISFLVALVFTEVEDKQEEKNPKKHEVFDLDESDFDTGYSAESGSLVDSGFGNGALQRNNAHAYPNIHTITRNIAVPVPAPYPVHVERRVPVPVRHTVHVPVVRPYPVHVLRPYPVAVDRPVPVHINRPYPVAVLHPVPVPVPRPVHVHVPVPMRVINSDVFTRRDSKPEPIAFDSWEHNIF